MVREGMETAVDIGNQILGSRASVAILPRPGVADASNLILETNLSPSQPLRLGCGVGTRG